MVFVSTVAVGVVGVPVNAGDANGAFNASESATVLTLLGVAAVVVDVLEVESVS